MNPHKHSVLIVDDSNLSIMVLTRILESEYTLYKVNNGREAIKVAEQYLPDVILLDILMPDMDGYDVIAVLKKSQKTKDIPILFITGLDKPGDEEKGLALGAVDYILKPFSPATVRLRVRNQIMMLEQLRSNEYNILKYRLTSEALNIALWDMDVVSTDPVNPLNQFMWSPELRHMLGFADENDFPNLLHSWSDRLHPEDKKKTLNAFAAHLNDRTGRTPFDVEYRLKLKNGNYRHFHALGTTLRDSVGTPLRVAGALRDITEKKQLAEMLRYREKMVEALNLMAITLLSQTKETFDYSMSDAIRPIAGVVGLSRIDIYRVRDVGTEKCMAQVYRWDQNKIGSAPLLDVLKALPFSQPAVADWVVTLSKDEVVNIHTGIMSEDETAFLTQFSVKSLLLTPVFKDGELWGIVAFQDNTHDRYFDDDSIEILRSAAFLWANAHMRNDMDRAITEAHTQLRDASEKFESMAHWYKSLLDAVPLIISATDAEMNWTFVNKAAEDSLASKRECLLGKPCSHWNLPVCGTEDCAVARAKQGKKRSYITHQDLSYQIDIEFLRGLDGEISGFIKVMQDITEIQRMAKERADAERESHLKAATLEYAHDLSSALSNITKSPTVSAGFLQEAANLIAMEGCKVMNAHRVGIWLIDEEKSVLNNISLYDSSVGDYVIQDDFDFSNREKYFTLLISERLIIANDREAVDAVLNLADGFGPELCAILDAPIRLDGKLGGVVCVEHDYCEQYPERREWTLEEQNFVASLADLMALAISSAERRVARDAAEIASRAKSAFLAMMSHEIRTPMNAIWGITEILMQSETLPKEMTEGLDRIHSSCGLLLGIINDILDFSKMEAGKMDVVPAQYKIASLINDAIHMNMMRIGDKSIEFELRIDENIPAKLFGDELRIKQILNNILSNAFKYTDDGKVTLSIASESGMDCITLILSVQDTGCGMTKEQTSKLFEEYSQFGKESNRTIEGTGLGLAITQRLVRLMDGEIRVESEPNKGSLFTVTLPQGRVDDDVLSKEVVSNLQQFRSNYITHTKRSKIVRDLMPYGRVLIVDDMETNIYVAVRLMKPYGLQIDTAASGIEALEKIKEGKVYDIVFMDHMMPEMDGIETTQRLRELGYTHPIVALTANAVTGQADMFLQNGFDSFVSKPIDIRQLNAVLNKLIRDKQPPEVVEKVRRQRDTANGEGDTAEQPQMNALLLESVIKDAKKSIATLEDIFQSGGLETEEGLRMYIISVHGIKGSLGNIGETWLAAAARELEMAGREQNLDLIKESTDEFLTELRGLIDKLEADRDADSEGETMQTLYNRLLAIEKMCTEQNKQGALELLKETKQSSEETKTFLNSIRESVLQDELEEAASATAAYANVLAVVLDEG